MEKHCSKEGKNKLSKSPLTEIKDEDIAEAVERAKNKARNTLEVLGMDKLLQIHSVWDNENTTDLVGNTSIQDDDADDDDNEDDGNFDHDSNETSESSCNSSDSRGSMLRYAGANSK